MLRISPIQIIAGLVAVGLAAACLFYGSKARQGVSDILSIKPARPAAVPAVEVGARPAGTQVIPIGVAAPASAAPARRASGG